MKCIHLGAIVFSCAMLAAMGPADAGLLHKELAAKAAPSCLNMVPPLFVANAGQWSEAPQGSMGPVRFAYQGRRASALLADSAICFAARQSESEEAPAERRMISVSFPGSQSVRPAGVGEAAAQYNYCIGGDPAAWRTGVPAYGRIVYRNLYSGIDLIVSSQERHLKYEFHVAPGADWRRIRIAYDGVERLELAADGRLHISTFQGELVEEAPFIYQERNGVRAPVEGRFELLDASSYTFSIRGDVDPSAVLVIDPYVAWSTFYGGSTGPVENPGYDTANGIAADTSGNALITGETWSNNLPVPHGSRIHLTGKGDAYVAKFSAAGSLVWATYFGGSQSDAGNAIACDASGNVFVGGSTYSNNFPTLHPWDSSFNGIRDGFVAKFTSSGALSWSTYLGGSDSDVCLGVAADATGEYVTGETASSNFPMRDASDDSFNFGGLDAFVAKLTPGGSLDWSTYLGGSDMDSGDAIVIDSAAVYLAGVTQSNDFPVHDAEQTDRGGLVDAFVTKLDKNGSLTWSTYLGGGLEDYGDAIAVDAGGVVYVAGETLSTDFPVPHGVDTTLSGTSDAFVAKFSSAGVQSWGTYLGGGARDSCQGIGVDTSGIFLAGSTTSDNFPVTSDACDTTYNGDGDAFLAKLDTAGSVSYAAYFGGSHSDNASGLGLLTGRAAYVTGATSSSNLPVPAGWDKTFNGGLSDAFVARFSHLQWDLAVSSSPFSGISITGSPSGVTPYAPRCTDMTVATLRAPLSILQSGRYYVFIKWTRGTSSQPPGRNSLAMTMANDTDARAFYKTFKVLSITGPTTVYEKSGASYICRVFLTDHTNYTITPYVTWRDNSSYATIDRYGKLKTGSVPANRRVRLTATYAGKSCYLDVTIRNR